MREGPMDAYPYQIDYDWLAIDKLGQAAVFWTAGEGPLPVDMLLEQTLNEDAIAKIRALAPNGDGEVLVTVPDPSDVILFACRGLFVYDWTDVHRSERRTNQYELIGVPSAPRTYEEIAAIVDSSYQPVSLPVDSFAGVAHLDVASLVQCLRQ